MNNFQLKKALAEKYYDKYQELVQSDSTNQIDVIEKLLDNFLDEEKNEEANIYCNILQDVAKKEIQKMETRLLSYKRKLEIIERNNWKKIKIQDDFFYVRDNDNFAYKFQNTQQPIYMYNGKNWVKLASEHHIIDISSVDDF